MKQIESGMCEHDRSPNDSSARRGCWGGGSVADGGGPERRLPDRLKLLAHLAQEIPHFLALLDSFASVAPMLHRVLVAARSP